jgi:hypothetical protein
VNVAAADKPAFAPGKTQKTPYRTSMDHPCRSPCLQKHADANTVGLRYPGWFVLARHPGPGSVQIYLPLRARAILDIHHHMIGSAPTPWLASPSIDCRQMPLACAKSAIYSALTKTGSVNAQHIRALPKKEYDP